MEETNIPCRIERLEKICKEQISQVFSAESVVPDTMPDVAAILFADGQVFIRSGKITDGALSLEGTLEGTAVYLPEGMSAAEKLDFSIPVTMTARNERLDESCRMLFNTAVTGAEARAVNSRKISFRAEAAADVTVCRSGTIDFAVDTGEAVSPEVLSCEVDTGYIREIGEKTFTVSDDVDLPTSIKRLLWYQTELFAENAKRVGGKTILQGGVELRLLYLQPDSDTPCFESFRIPFSQLVDAADEEAVIAAVDLRTESCFVDILPGLNSSDSVSLEMQLTAQLVYVGEKKLKYISDAYSLRCPLIMERKTQDTTGPYIACAKKTTVKELLKLPEPANEILAVQLHMTPCVKTENGVKTSACVCILYQTENALRSVTKKLPVEFSIEMNGDCLYIKAVCSDRYASLQGDGIQLQFDAELTTVYAEMQIVDYVSNMEEDDAVEAAGRDYPSIVAVRPGGRTYWELAKTYHSTVALIESANADLSEKDSFLLIPRGR